PGPPPAPARETPPNPPAAIVFQLESTPAGCQWLLEQWAELSAALQQRQGWEWPDRFRALRLLGRRSIDRTHDPVVNAVFAWQIKGEAERFDELDLTGSD